MKKLIVLSILLLALPILAFEYTERLYEGDTLLTHDYYKATLISCSSPSIGQVNCQFQFENPDKQTATETISVGGDSISFHDDGFLLELVTPTVPNAYATVKVTTPGITVPQKEKEKETEEDEEEEDDTPTGPWGETEEEEIEESDEVPHMPTDVKISVRKGWNLLPLPTIMHMTEDQMSYLEKIVAFDASAQGYAESVKDFYNNERDIRNQVSAWYKSSKSFYIYYPERDFTEKMDAKDRWNFLFVPPSWNGKSFEDRGCNVKRFYFFDSGVWSEKMEGDYVFESYDVGLGLVADFDGACKRGYEEEEKQQQGENNAELKSMVMSTRNYFATIGLKKDDGWIYKEYDETERKVNFKHYNKDYTVENHPEKIDDKNKGTLEIDDYACEIYKYTAIDQIRIYYGNKECPEIKRFSSERALADYLGLYIAEERQQEPEEEEEDDTIFEGKVICCGDARDNPSCQSRKWVLGSEGCPSGLQRAAPTLCENTNSYCNNIKNRDCPSDICKGGEGEVSQKLYYTGYCLCEEPEEEDTGFEGNVICCGNSNNNPTNKDWVLEIQGCSGGLYQVSPVFCNNVQKCPTDICKNGKGVLSSQYSDKGYCGCGESQQQQEQWGEILWFGLNDIAYVSNSQNDFMRLQLRNYDLFDLPEEMSVVFKVYSVSIGDYKPLEVWGPRLIQSNEDPNLYQGSMYASGGRNADMGIASGTIFVCDVYYQKNNIPKAGLMRAPKCPVEINP